MKIPSTQIKVVGFGEFSAAIYWLYTNLLSSYKHLALKVGGGVAEDNYDSACSVHEILQPCPLLMKTPILV